MNRATLAVAAIAAATLAVAGCSSSSKPAAATPAASNAAPSATPSTDPSSPAGAAASGTPTAAATPSTTTPAPDPAAPSDKPTSAPTASVPAPTPPAPVKLPAPVSVDQATSAIGKLVPTALNPTVITADNDPNHLLGKPGQYTSMVTFTDNRVSPGDVDKLNPTDVQRGAAIEVFTTAAEAQARSTYLQGLANAIPAAAEYNYLHGPLLIRVSHFLTAAQAADYDKAGTALG